MVSGSSSKASASNNPEVVKAVELKTDIKVNPNTNNPDKAWEILKVSIKKEPLELLHLDHPKPDNAIRFVCISDTHSRIERMHHEIPQGDVLIHAGDFTNVGLIEDVKNFSLFLKNIDHKFKYKVVIAGNHELTFDPENSFKLSSKRWARKTKDETKDPREFVENCIYLEDSSVELFGIKIYGSPWQPRFGDWAFNLDRGEDILKKWNKIPNDTDILITHGPPLGFGDKVTGGYHVGCSELLSTIRDRVHPKYHVFGHIHEDFGMWTDGQTTYINASTCNFRYIPANPPIIFDIIKPVNQSISKNESTDMETD